MDIQIRVLLFSVLRERVGKQTLSVTLTPPATGRTLVRHLESVYPGIAPYRDVIRLAVNEVYSTDDTLLNTGDEVALITPVSGG